MAKSSIGIIGGGANWLGGYNYLANIVRVLREYREKSGQNYEIVICADDQQSKEFGTATLELADRVVPVNPHDIPRDYLSNVEVCFRKGRLDLRAARLLSFARKHRLHYLFPAVESVAGERGVRSLAWIPDFGHMTSIDANDEHERKFRDQYFGYIASKADRILLSSEDARNQFATVFPEQTRKTFLFRFRTSIAPQSTEACAEASRIYGLPARYAIVCNQLWKHKRHLDVVQAIAALKNQGKNITVVFTGPLTDYRSPQHLDDVLQAIHTLGVHDNFRILGRIPRSHQLALLQQSAFVIQPSECEGWNTGVEESRCLGKTLVLSDIGVHREQFYPGCHLFKVGDVDMLAQVIGQQWLEEREQNHQSIDPENYSDLRMKSAEDFLNALGVV